MRVLLVSSSSGSTGGGEVYLYYLACGLVRLGHQVCALCSTSPEMDKFAEVLGTVAEITRVDTNNTYQRPARSLSAAIDYIQQRRLTRIFHEICPEILHVNQQVAEDGLDLVLAARRSGIPFLSTIHISRSAEELSARFGRVRDIVTGRVLRSVNAVHLTVAESARAELLQRFSFFSPGQVRVVVNGVFNSNPQEEVRSDIRRRWGLSKDEVVLGSVGRLEPQKAPLFGLEIVASLRRKGFPVRYLWIGDGPMRPQFEKSALELGIGDYVRLDGWRQDVSNCLQGLDVLVMPSNYEGMPLALLEGMTAGLCCCGSDIDGISEAIEHESSGYLCRPGDLDDWCQQLEMLIRDPDRRITAGKRGREVAQQRFSVESMARATADAYRDVMRSHRVI